MATRFIVRAFPGNVIKDFYDYAIPSYIILMIATNDSMNKTSETLLVELLQLRKLFATKTRHIVPNLQV